MRKWMWAGVIVVVAIAGFFLLRHKSSPDAAAQSEAAPSVQLATVRYGDFSVVLSEAGHVGAPAGTTSQLSFPNPGILRNVYVRVGEHISAGEPLASQDTRPLSLAAQQAAADAQAAQAQASAAAVDRFSTKLAVDRAAVARAQRLYAAGVVAVKDVEAARAQLDADLADAKSAGANRTAAQAQAQSASVKAELANTDLARGTLTSPVDGVVTAINKRPGEPVDPTTPVISVGPPQQREATLQVPSADAAQITVGDPAKLHIAGVEASSAGRVLAVVPAIDPSTQAATVVVSGVPANAVGGNAVQADITVSNVHGLLVPQSAIVQDPQSGDNVVFVQQRQKDGSIKFAQRTVSIAHEDGKTAQLSAGVSPGQKVAAQGAFELLAPAGGGG